MTENCNWTAGIVDDGKPDAGVYCNYCYLFIYFFTSDFCSSVFKEPVIDYIETNRVM